MILRQTSTAIFTVIVALITSTAAAKAATFNFTFDNTGPGSGGTTPPFVGTGTFSFDGNPGIGTFQLNSLPNYSFNFNLGSATFTNSNIVTPTSEVLAVISQGSSGPQVNFSNSNSSGSGSGPSGGSIDFQSGSGSLNLTFEPPAFAAPGATLNLYQANDGSTSYFGKYQGVQTTVPEPSSMLGTLAFGILGVGYLLKCQCKKAAMRKSFTSV